MGLIREMMVLEGWVFCEASGFWLMMLLAPLPYPSPRSTEERE